MKEKTGRTDGTILMVRAWQKDNGPYTRVANNIIEKLAQAPLTASELRVVLYIMRQTYGWRRKETKISIHDISKSTKIAKRHIYRILDRLEVDNVIVRKGSSKDDKLRHLRDNSCDIPGTTRDIPGTTFWGEKSAQVIGINKKTKEWGAKS